MNPRDPHQHVVCSPDSSSDSATILLLHPADIVDPGCFCLGLAELKPIRAEEELATLLGMLVVSWNRKSHLPASRYLNLDRESLSFFSLMWLFLDWTDLLLHSLYIILV